MVCRAHGCCWSHPHAPVQRRTAPRSVWCKLLEQSHLLDRLVTRRLHGENTSNSSSSSSGGGSFLALLERRITLVPCADSVLAALVQHCQLVVAAGTSLHVTSAAPPGATGGTAAKQQGALDTACLSAALEQHSAARALPLLLRMYCTSAAHAEVWLGAESAVLIVSYLHAAASYHCPPSEPTNAQCVLVTWMHSLQAPACSSGLADLRRRLPLAGLSSLEAS